MCFACWITKAAHTLTNTLRMCNTDFPRLQWLRERAPVFHYTCVARLQPPRVSAVSWLCSVSRRCCVDTWSCKKTTLLGPHTSFRALNNRVVDTPPRAWVMAKRNRTRCLCSHLSVLVKLSRLYRIVFDAWFVNQFYILETQVY